jgi:spore coat polysaccharide biosynthesis protein SpsF (cytidylyltransferase family)
MHAHTFFCPVVAFETIQNNVQLHINTREDYKMRVGDKNGVHGGTVEIMTVSEIYKVAVSVFVSDSCHSTTDHYI